MIKNKQNTKEGIMYEKETKTHESSEYHYKDDYLSDLDIHDNYITDFEAYEAMLQGQVYDTVSKSINKSSITDSYAATLAIERAARVMGKLPEGVTQAAVKKDAGKAVLLDILRQKWVYPNANSQRSFFEKLRLWQLYSSVYGYMPMFYDWNITNSGYVGPDCWLWNPRNLIPQQGKVSIEDMDYVTALSWVGESTLVSWMEDEEGGWDKENLQKLIDIASDLTTSKDTKRDTLIDRNRTMNDVKKGVCIATRYESGKDGRWISFAPDNGCMKLRDIANPHKNSRIPFVVKYCQPLFDSFYGMGDFQRAKPLQFARDGLTNFYFAGIKTNLSPPIVVNANGVMKHTLDMSKPQPIIMETIPGSVRRLDTSTAGLSTYQAAQSQLTGSLLSLYGTQNASIPGAEALNPSQGKTPAAVSMYSDKEASRDGQERAYLEAAIESLTDGFNTLIANINTEPIPINMFSEEIEEIQKMGYEDILELVEVNKEGTQGTLVIKPGSLKNVEARFNISAGSSEAINKQKKIEDIQNTLATIGKYQNILKEDPTIKMNWSVPIQLLQELTGVKGLEDFITVIPQEEIDMQKQQEMDMQAQAQAQTQAQPQPTLAPAATSIRGNVFNNPDIAAVAQEIDQQQ
jgi:hypothetical protein